MSKSTKAQILGHLRPMATSTWDIVKTALTTVRMAANTGPWDCNITLDMLQSLEDGRGVQQEGEE